jgi:hypothetical protein
VMGGLPDLYVQAEEVNPLAQIPNSIASLPPRRSQTHRSASLHSGGLNLQWGMAVSACYGTVTH